MSELAQKGGKLRKIILRQPQDIAELSEGADDTIAEVSDLREQLEQVTIERDAAEKKLEAIATLLRGED